MQVDGRTNGLRKELVPPKEDARRLTNGDPSFGNYWAPLQTHQQILSTCSQNMGEIEGPEQARVTVVGGIGPHRQLAFMDVNRKLRRKGISAITGSKKVGEVWT